MTADPAYKVVRVERMMACLRSTFPTATPDGLNVVLFATGGTHGSFTTVDQARAAYISGKPKAERTVTVMILKPRICRIEYGLVVIGSLEDAGFLRDLQEASREILGRL